MELGIVQAPLVTRNDVGLVVAIQRVGLVIYLSKISVGNRITQLFDRTWLCHHVETSSLLRGQLRALILRHRVDNVTVIVDAQLLLTARGGGVARTDVLALGIVGFRNHTRHGV